MREPRARCAGGITVPEKLIVTTLENKPGTIAHVGEVLGRENVNIEAVAGVDAGGEGRLVLLVSDPEEAFQVLRREGFQVEQRTALMMMVSNEAGELGRLTRRIADAGVNVDALVTTREGRVVAAVSDYEKAAEAVGGAAVVTR